MKRLWKRLKRLHATRFGRVTLGVSVVSVLLLWIVPYVWLRPSDPQQLVSLHYNVYFGVDWVGSWRGVLALPGVVTGVWVVNTLWAQALHEDQSLLARMLCAGHACVSVLGVLALYFVLWINV